MPVHAYTYSLIAASALWPVSASPADFAPRWRCLALSLPGSMAHRRPTTASRAGRRRSRRIRKRCTLCHPDRSRERQRALREERRSAVRAVEHAEADDGRSRLQRTEEGHDQADRRVPGQRVCVAARRRAGRRLDHVRCAEEPDQGRGSAARARDPERQRRLHHSGRRHRRQRARLHRNDDQARARARPHAGDVRQRKRHLRSRQQDDGARARKAGAAHRQRIVRSSIRCSPSANSPGTRSGSRTAIRC